MTCITIYLHQVPKNDYIPKGALIFLEQKVFKHKHLEKKLQDLPPAKRAKEASLLDFWFLADKPFHVEFGNTMPKKHWRFWDSTFCQFPGMAGCPITFNNADLGANGDFKPANISRASKDNRRLSFKYTGKNGTKAKPLSCKYELYIKNICQYKGQKFETKIILDPIGQNNGERQPFTGG